MLKKLLFSIGVLIIANFEINAQNKAVKFCKSNSVAMTAIKPAPVSQIASNTTETQENEHPYGGTFEFIAKKNSPKEVFTTDILKLIEEKRLDDQEQIIVLSPTTKLRILSKKQISSPGFQPFKYLYLYE
ncbi:MAG: hypothetical protein A3F72_00790 [Bacteroidetes bacterium RIFCSPLOWO2_12_FULL_35_15]|nr:MAG: hypothetical protein A3F72_00790 [Bacteroidetes bacterium RIFCSPLOWO2_12_FULL_35_15]